MTKLPYKFVFVHVDFKEYEYIARCEGDEYVITWDHTDCDGDRSEGTSRYDVDDVDKFINRDGFWIITEILVESFPKFNVGEKVKVVHQGYGFGEEEMGEIVTISEVGEHKYASTVWAYRIEEDKGNTKHGFLGGWHGERSFEKYESSTYPELKTGMRVVFNGVKNRFIYVRDLDIFVGDGCSVAGKIVNFEGDPTKGYTISEVYEAPENTANLFSNHSRGNRVYPPLTEEERQVIELKAQYLELKKQMGAIEDAITEKGGNKYDLM